MENKTTAPLYVSGLCKNYPGFQLKSVSFSLEAGKITGFIGRNGAGKTTTINSVLSLIHPDAGEVLFSGLSRTENAREVLRLLLEQQEQELNALAWKAANDSMLGSGIGIRENSAAFLIRGLKEGKNIEYYAYPSEEESRRMGANSARAIKKQAFKGV